MLALVLSTLSTPSFAADKSWTDISSPLIERLTQEGAKPEWPGGCSGVVVNRKTGEVTLKVVGLGLWRRTNPGAKWERIDGGTVSGRDETGWATTVDADDPRRMASFSLDGGAAWTSDGTHWKRLTSLGRNWDYGSVDWSAPEPMTLIAAKHETTPPGEVYVTLDGGITWRQLAIHLSENRGAVSMVGALAARTLIYAKDDGIHRSTDAGDHWSKVSSFQPQTRIPVRFGGVFYLGTAQGLIASEDQGATWRALGSPADVWLGPFFGRDAREILVVGKTGVRRTRDAGATWTRVADLKPNEPGFHFTPNWFGCYAWDPIGNILYASAMGNAVYRIEL